MITPGFLGVKTWFKKCWGLLYSVHLVKNVLRWALYVERRERDSSCRAIATCLFGTVMFGRRSEERSHEIEMDKCKVNSSSPAINEASHRGIETDVYCLQSTFTKRGRVFRLERAFFCRLYVTFWLCFDCLESATIQNMKFSAQNVTHRTMCFHIKDVHCWVGIEN